MKILMLLTLIVAALPATAGKPDAEDPCIVVLGTAQDAGYPQAGCDKECCRQVLSHPDRQRYTTSLAIVDPKSNQRWLIDCTPDFREQLRLLDRLAPVRQLPGQDRRTPALDGILLTHAHVGHYAGLIHLGREVIGANAVPVFAMPRMSRFLRNNGPWSQLVSLRNIDLKPLFAGQAVRLNERLQVTPIVVPHRDEFSETVGFLIDGPKRKAAFIPDIDKWERWNRDVEDILQDVDVAWLDGTFYANGEIPGRDMSQIPHPFIQESLHRFRSLPLGVRNRIRFIHMNHTNPALRPEDAARRVIEKSGCGVAEQGEIFRL